MSGCDVCQTHFHHSSMLLLSPSNFIPINSFFLSFLFNFLFLSLSLWFYICMYVNMWTTVLSTSHCWVLISGSPKRSLKAWEEEGEDNAYIQHSFNSDMAPSDTLNTVNTSSSLGFIFTTFSLTLFPSFFNNFNSFPIIEIPQYDIPPFFFWKIKHDHRRRPKDGIPNLFSKGNCQLGHLYISFGQILISSILGCVHKYYRPNNHGPHTIAYGLHL